MYLGGGDGDGERETFHAFVDFVLQGICESVMIMTRFGGLDDFRIDLAISIHDKAHRERCPIALRSFSDPVVDLLFALRTDLTYGKDWRRRDSTE